MVWWLEQLRNSIEDEPDEESVFSVELQDSVSALVETDVVTEERGARNRQGA